MDSKPLFFATSGIRGKSNLVIGPELAIRVGRAVSSWIYQQDLLTKGKFIYVGFDNRRNSKAIANCLAAAINSSGLNVTLFNIPVPTPLVIHATVSKNALAGLMVTGSHLPAEDNGIILFDGEGKYFKGILSESKEKPVSWIALGKTREATTEITDYTRFLYKIYTELGINKTEYKVLLDPVHGPMKCYLKEVITPIVKEIVTINWEDDDTLSGRGSEPTPQNIEKTKNEVLKQNCDLGMATDMDGDRIIFISKKGRIITGDYMGAILSELIWDLYPTSPIIVPINTSAIINITAKRLNKKIKYCKVGPPNIIDGIIANHAKFGFEETGKYIFSEYGIWPDSAISVLMLFSLLQCKNTALDDIYDNMHSLTSVKTKLPTQRENAALVMKKLPKLIREKIQGISEINEMDGIRINFHDQSWLLIRPSGTEDYIRVFAEHSNPKEAEKLNKLGEKIILDAIQELHID